MAYPPEYTRTFSFTDFETTNPDDPKPGDSLDIEFDDVSNALTATQENLALIQRADGQLANDSVGEDQLQEGLLDDLVIGITDDAEAAAAAAAASASAAAGSAASAATSASDAAAQVGIAAGHAASAGVSQGIAQTAADDAEASAEDAADEADAAELAANSVLNSVAQAQLHEEMAFKWAEYLAAPVAPAPPGWPEAVDDGMFSAKWWALRARDYNEVHDYDFGTAGTNPGEAFDIWDLTNDLEDPPGLVYMTWGTPPRTYVLTDPSDPSDPNSWMDITGADGPPGPIGPIGPPGPPNTLTIGTVTTGLPGTPADATITGTAPNQVLNMTIPAGADGAGTTLVAASGTIGLTAVAGAAATAARSDSTPPLSQAIAPTWTGAHLFRGGVSRGGAVTQITLGAVSTIPLLGLTNSAAPTDAKTYEFYTTNIGELVIQSLDEAVTGGHDVLRASRTGAAITALTFGNATDSPSYSFLGTGTATFNGTVDLLGPLHATSVAGVPGQVLSSKGPGVAPEWRTSSGGSIELGYNFSTAVGTANPGSQKMSMNSAVYASVNTLVFNALAMTNFDANTILSLLTTGNRIYIQQRNDSSKAVVYEVTGPGTNLTGYWTIPVTIIQSRGTLFGANADLNVVFILSVSSTSLANPTALVGLTAVNGSATTGMRSDAAPALNQGIAPTWSGIHTWGSGTPEVRFDETDQASGSRLWRDAVAAQIRTFQIADDAGGTLRNWLAVYRTGAAVSTLEFGNATNNPTYTFLGTGAINFGGLFRGPDGTVAAPAYSFTEHPGSGMWWNHGGNYLGFSANGFESITASSAGVSLNVPTNITQTLNVNAAGAGNSAINANAPGSQYAQLSCQLTATEGLYIINNYSGATQAGIPTGTTGISNVVGSPFIFATAATERARFTGSGSFQIIGPYSGGTGASLAPGIEIAMAGGGTYGLILCFNRATTSYIPLEIQGGYFNITSGSTADFRMTGRRALTDSNDTYLRINNNSDYTSGIYTPLDIRTQTWLISELGVRDAAGAFQLRLNHGAFTYGTVYISGARNGFTGYAIDAGGALAPNFMSNGSSFGIHSEGDGKWLLLRSSSTAAATYYNLEVPALYTTAASGGLMGAGTINATAYYINGVAIAGASFPLLAPNGSVSAPSYSFSSAATTGMYLGAAGQIDFTCSGVRRAYISGSGSANSYVNAVRDALATGEVGIGVGGGTGGVNWFMYMPASSNTLTWNGNGANRASLDTAGAFSAASFTSTSSRAIKRETGKPSFVRDILARLRPIFYRLLDGGDREQLGLIAEEVHDVCPQLSDGKTVAYDRLALLLLAAWQDEHLEAA